MTDNINFKACAYYILRSVKKDAPDRIKPDMASLTKLLGCTISNKDKKFVNDTLNMHYTSSDNYVEGIRNIALALNDAYQLVYIWYWVANQQRNANCSLDNEAKELAALIIKLLGIIKDASKQSLNDHRDIGKSITATYLANYLAFTKYFGDDAGKTYKYLANNALNTLDLKEIFEGT